MHRSQAPRFSLFGAAPPLVPVCRSFVQPPQSLITRFGAHIDALPTLTLTGACCGTVTTTTERTNRQQPDRTHMLLAPLLLHEDVTAWTVSLTRTHHHDSTEGGAYSRRTSRLPSVETIGVLTEYYNHHRGRRG